MDLKSNKTGGSNAYENVMSTQQKCCSEIKPNLSNTSPYQFPKVNLDNITAKLIVDNYGSIYKTTGGGIQENLKKGSDKLVNFVKKVNDNRILDIYIKYMGIKTLTTSTLVPLGLIMGQDVLTKAINFIINSDKHTNQIGGNYLEQKIPVLDDNLIGSYLKLAGLTAINLSPATLIPLGIIMSMYEIYNRDSNKKGGGRYITGQDIPTNIIQDIGATLQGRPNSFSDGAGHYGIRMTGHRGINYHNEDMQLLPPDSLFNSSKHMLKPYNVDVPGFGGDDLKGVGVQDPKNEITIRNKVARQHIGPEFTEALSEVEHTVDATFKKNASNELSEVGAQNTHPPHKSSYNAWDESMEIPNSMAGGAVINNNESINLKEILKKANELGVMDIQSNDTDSESLDINEIIEKANKSGIMDMQSNNTNSESVDLDEIIEKANKSGIMDMQSNDTNSESVDLDEIIEKANKSSIMDIQSNDSENNNFHLLTSSSSVLKEN